MEKTDPNIDLSWKSNSKPEFPENKPAAKNLPPDLLDPFEEAEQKSKAPIEPKNTAAETPQGTFSVSKYPSRTPAETIKLPKSTPIAISKPEPIAPTTPIVPREQKNIQEEERTPLWKSILKTLGLFVGIVIFVYIFLNFPALYDKFAYAINPPKIAENAAPTVQTEVIIKPMLPSTGPEIFLDFAKTAMTIPIKYIAPAPTPQETPKNETPAEEPATETEENTESGTIADNTLVIPRLGKKVPIIWESAPDDDVMLENLKKGVVHYAGTALPGQGKGPIFISGHSSYYWWDNGKYKTVFANLDKVVEGDEIQIRYNNQTYTYKVFEKVVVMPDDVSVLAPTNEAILDLMTCVPVGTNQKRLIVKAKQI